MTTTAPMSTGTTSTTVGDGDGDPFETENSAGSDYGGPPPDCEQFISGELVLGLNEVDTSGESNGFSSSCGALSGTEKDALFSFVAATDGPHTVSLTTEVEAWLLEAEAPYCYTPFSADCSLPQGPMVIELSAGETAYLLLDGVESGPATIEITEG